MTTFGHIAAYDETAESWTQYAERVEQYFVANEITDAGRKRAIFLTVIGPKTYGLLRSIVAPEKPADMAFEDLLKALKGHFTPAPSEIVQRFHFYSRVRQPGESVATFLSELRRLSEFCNYTTTLDEMLRDRLVCGIQDAQIQRRLLSEKKLTLTTATELAVAMESATRNANVLQMGSSATTAAEGINKLHNTSGLGKQVKNQFSGKFRPKDSELTSANSSVANCVRCGSSQHSSSLCPHKNVVCFNCGKVGHFSKKCFKGKQGYKKNRVVDKVHEIQEIPVLTECKHKIQPTNGEYDLFHVSASDQAPQPIKKEFRVNGLMLTMEVDSGAAFSLIPSTTYYALKDKLPNLEPCTIQLRTFAGQQLKVLGCIRVPVFCDSEVEEIMLSLLVVSEGKTNLCGRNWIQQLKLKIEVPDTGMVNQTDTIGSDQNSFTLRTVLEKHSELFETGLGLMKGIKVHLSLKSDQPPKFFKARPVPYAMKEKVSDELDRLQNSGIITPVRSADWAAPIVPVLKSDKKSVRICGDYKVTINSATDLEQYPLPKIEDLFAQLAGGERFSKLDLRDAYNQLELDDQSKKLVVVNTHKGLFQYNRLPFGVASAPAIFQRSMDTLLQGIPSVSVFLDDLLVTGENDEKHLKTLDAVLSRLREAGLKLNIEKCKFLVDEVIHLGHVIDKNGLRPCEAKLAAIDKAPSPTSVEELRSFLGLLTYYAKFLPNMSTLLAPLYQLLHHSQPWQWTKVEENSFEEAKKKLRSPAVLAHFDPERELVLGCDASPYGLGAVLSHSMPDGKDRPIAFASRSLTSAEKNYSHIEKEALALVFGVTRFRDYLLGREFVLLTDHRPLVTLFSESKPVPAMAASRIQRWALTLAAYSYKIRFRKGSLNGNADALSRLPLPTPDEIPPPPAELVLLVNTLDDGPVTSSQIKQASETDPVLSEVMNYVRQGWPKSVPEAIRHFDLRRNELSVENGILFWGNRVVIPSIWRPAMLAELHDGHQGMSAVKSLARSFLWWPGIDKDIEEKVRHCSACQQNASMPPSKIFSWPLSSVPWSRVHLDYAGPIDNRMLLVVIDSYAKWIEVVPVSSASSATTARVFLEMCARFGLPHCVVSDNGTPFTGSEFQEFVKRNGIRHVRTAPYHPSSNGLAERAVRIVKTGLAKLTTGTLQDRLNRLLFNYRRAPLMAIGSSPAELLLGRPIRTRLDLVRPSPTIPKEEYTALDHTAPGQPILARNYGVGSKWIPGVVIKPLGRSMMEVSTPIGTLRRHHDQVRRSGSANGFSPFPISSPGTDCQFPSKEENTPVIPNAIKKVPTPVATTSPATNKPDDVPIVRRSTRLKRVPKRLGL